MTKNPLVQHAVAELERGGFFKQPREPGDMPALGPSVLRIVEAFAVEEHSGFSAMATLELVNRLCRFQALGGPTSDPDEWMEIGDQVGADGVTRPLSQNRRQATTFSTDGGKTWYDLDQPTEILIRATVVVAHFDEEGSARGGTTDHRLDITAPVTIQIHADGDFDAEAVLTTSVIDGSPVPIPLNAADAPIVAWLLAHHVHHRPKASTSTGGGDGRRYLAYDYGTVEVPRSFSDEHRWIFRVDKQRIGDI